MAGGAARQHAHAHSRARQAAPDMVRRGCTLAARDGRLWTQTGRGEGDGRLGTRAGRRCTTTRTWDTRGTHSRGAEAPGAHMSSFQASRCCGRGRSYVAQDVLRRVLEAAGVVVHQVMGMTDIDDKILQRAAENGVSWQQLARTYEERFLQDMDALGVRDAAAVH